MYSSSFVLLFFRSLIVISFFVFVFISVICLQVRKDKFPRGIKFVADYAHAKGLKLGIYSAHGSRTCMGNAGTAALFNHNKYLYKYIICPPDIS